MHSDDDVNHRQADRMLLCAYLRFTAPPADLGERRRRGRRRSREEERGVVERREKRNYLQARKLPLVGNRK